MNESIFDKNKQLKPFKKEDITLNDGETLSVTKSLNLCANRLSSDRIAKVMCDFALSISSMVDIDERVVYALKNPLSIKEFNAIVARDIFNSTFKKAPFASSNKSIATALFVLNHSKIFGNDNMKMIINLTNESMHDIIRYSLEPKKKELGDIRDRLIIEILCEAQQEINKME